MQNNKTIACYALSQNGAILARNLAKKLGASLYLHEKLASSATQEHIFQSLPSLIAKNFNKYSAHIFIGAVGIAVRCIAPHLLHKGLDPAVIVCDEQGQYAIPILSGHWGGSNELATLIAQELASTHNTIATITTATDVQAVPAIDLLAKEKGCIILDWDKIKCVSSAILRKEKVQIVDEIGLFSDPSLAEYFEFCNKAPINFGNNLPAIWLSYKKNKKNNQLLRLTLPILHMGIGCKQGTSKQDILYAIEQALNEFDLETRALACLASVDIKSNEAGILEAAKELDLPIRFFDAKKLAKIPVQNPSAKAAELLQVDKIGVCEASAIFAAGEKDTSLIVPKIVYKKSVTVAIAINNNFISNCNS